MKAPFLAHVLCPLCVRQGGLRIFIEYISNTVPVATDGTLRLSVCEVPVMSCSLPGCKLILVGWKEGNEAVFPDPHVSGGGGTPATTPQDPHGEGDAGDSD